MILIAAGYACRQEESGDDILMIGNWEFVDSIANSSLEKNPTIISIFTLQESKELEEIRNYFLSQIAASENIPKSESMQCFYNFMLRLKAGVHTGGMDLKMDYNNQESLYNYAVSSEIWNAYTVGYENQDTITYYDLNIHGKYAEYLMKMGEEIPYVKNYYDEALNAGAIGAAC